MPLLQEIGLLPDGGVLAAGFDRGSNSVRLVRYTSAGRLDPAFGVEGLVSVPVPPG
jgi:hypothetical protein